MQQVIINVGVSGSGKTTWTSKFIKENPNWIRINRDDIRKTLVGSLDGYYQRKDLNFIEELINTIEDYIFFEAIDHNLNIIIDNTNLKESYINRWLKEIENRKDYNKIEVKFKIFDTKLEDCKRRVEFRDGLRGEQLEYIYKQYQSFNNIEKIIKEKYKDKIYE